MNEIICLKCGSHDDYYETSSGFDSCTNCRSPIFVGKKDQEKTLRDYFAGQAIEKLPLSFYRDSYGNMFNGWQEKFAKDAYKLADAMIKERNK